jgi:Flp pilus assembly protein TadD
VLALAGLGGSFPTLAQGVPQRSSTPGGTVQPGGSVSQPAISRPIVQPTQARDGMALDAALGRLARNPRDIDALIAAGNAALAMGDIDAATGFFRRAEQVSPGNPRATAGLAGSLVRNGDPFDAIPLFDQADKSGALDGPGVSDRGLAYDLVGDNATAQRYYRQSLARSPDEEAVRRLALSLAISGDKLEAEKTISPLLAQHDLAAWRTRAFALAILGQTEEAVSIANNILPVDIASGIAPYLRYMPRLTRAQQAAAANFGAFPRASEIGRDDPRVAQYAPRIANDVALTPQGEPLGRKSRGRDRNRDRASRQQNVAAAPVPPPAVSASQIAMGRIAPPEPQPARQNVAEPAYTSVTPSARLATPATAPAVSPPAPPMRVVTPAPGSAPASTAYPPAPRTSTSAPRVAEVAPVTSRPAVPGPGAVPSGYKFAPSAPPPPAAPTNPPPAPPVSAPPAAPVLPVPATPVPPPPPRATTAPPRSLSDAFAEFQRPSTDVTPSEGAVDVRRIKPGASTQKKAAEPAKPLPPSHPSRIWVQIATGRDKAALGFDWRRMTRDAAEVFRGKEPFVTAWGQTNRLLTGPFQSEAAANSFIGQLRRADVDGAFVWTSPAGQVVDALPIVASRH